MSTLVSCRQIGSHNLKRDDSLRAIVVDDELVIFTPMEYRLVLALLDKEMVADTCLVQALFATKILDKSIRKNLEKHVENIKVKLRQTGLYVRRIYRYGYSLVAEQDDSVSHDATS